MKATFVFLTGFLLAVSTYGAGEVDFANTPTSLLKTNACSGGPDGVTTGGGHYTVGLYIAPFGTTDPNAFSLVATTPSQSGLGNGRFNGGNITIPNNNGIPITTQIRVWSTFAGSTYEEAIGNFSPGRYIGFSRVGFVIPTANALQLPPRIMGNDYGQIPGFTFYACITPPNPAPPLTNAVLHINRSNNVAHVVSWPNAASTHLLEWTPTVPGSNQWTPILSNVANIDSSRLSYSSTNSVARFYRLRRL